MCRIDMLTREQVPSLTTTPLPSPLPFPLPPPSLKKVLAPPPLTSPHLYPSQGCDGTDEEEWHAYRIAHGLPRFNNERIRSLAHLSSRLRLHYGGLRPCASGTLPTPLPPPPYSSSFVRFISYELNPYLTSHTLKAA